jgi:hypothetical protein
MSSFDIEVNQDSHAFELLKQLAQLTNRTKLKAMCGLAGSDPAAAQRIAI